jgi:hypothetical protein
MKDKDILEDQPTPAEARGLIEFLQKIVAPKDSLPADGPATIQQVAAYFQVTEKTIREWQKEKPSFPKPANFGKSLRWDAKKVRAYWAKVA